MKNFRYFLFTLLLVVEQALFGQFNTTLNQNVASANTFGSAPQSYLLPKPGTAEKVQIIKLLTGEKDMTGADIAYFMVTSEAGKDTLFLVPDNPIMPIYLLKVDPRKSRAATLSSEGVRLGEFYFSGPSKYFLVNSKSATFCVTQGLDHIFKDFKKSDPDRTWYVDGLKSNLAFKKSEFSKLWSLIDDYQQYLIKKLASKSYDEHLLAMEGKVVHFLRTPDYIFQDRQKTGIPSFDRAIISFVKDNGGKLVEMKLNFPFIDGVFHEKENLTQTLKKDKNGLFVIPDNSAGKKLGTAKGNLIPMGSHLLVVDGKEGSNEWTATGAMFSEIWDFPAYNWVRFGSPYWYEGGGIQSDALYQDRALWDYSIEWWKKENIETDYIAQKDVRNFSVFMKTYMPEVLKTVK